jgi:hypothetical protein
MAYEKLNQWIEKQIPEAPPEHTRFDVLRWRLAHHEFDSLLRAAWEAQKEISDEAIPW